MPETVFWDTAAFGVTQAFTSDHHFEQAGYKRLI